MPLKDQKPLDEQAALERHRDGDARNELKRIGKSDMPAVPAVGGPHDGKVIHQPPEIAEVELVIDGKRHRYVSQGKEGERKFVYQEGG